MTSKRVDVFTSMKVDVFTSRKQVDVFTSREEVDVFTSKWQLAVVALGSSVDALTDDASSRSNPQNKRRGGEGLKAKH